jgi:glutamate N-acetyltransferase/amino-acid N-acetyltransferase
MTEIQLQPAVVPAGFRFACASAGIKVSGRTDLALAEAPAGASAAALFTRNRVVAAPLEVGRANLKLTRGRVRAVIVNSGNANCATGEAGQRACRQVLAAAAELFAAPATEIFPSSTGIIGVPLPAEKLVAALPQFLENRAADVAALERFAAAIMTTDTRPKLASAGFEWAGRPVTITGVAKGSGMIHPNLATMLVYLFTDVEAQPPELRRLLVAACNESFNCIGVDNDTSTNDTVLLLASGQSGVKLRQTPRPFAQALQLVCRSLAEQIVADGEGASHLLRLRVEQARTRPEARAVANAIANSMLVKTALAGADPNWGRILCAVGYSGVVVDPARVDIYIGGQQVCCGGTAHPFDEKAAHDHLAQRESSVRVSLGRGRAALDFLTSDLTAEYVRINAEYST